MSRALTVGEIKALFRQLVKAAGGVEAAGVELGVAHQRVSVLQNINTQDMPTFLQIITLEAVVGRAIVTGAAARAVEDDADDTVSSAAVDAVQSSASLLGAVHAMDADGRRDEAEVRDVQTRDRIHLQEAQAAFDAAHRLKPGVSHG